jgi:hypothetical protein
MKIAKFALPVIAAGILASSASAATTEFVVDPANIVPGVVANRLIADGEGLDWLSAVLVVRLDTGSIYNDPSFDGDRPNEGFWGLVPALPWDTWVGTLDAEWPGPYPVGENTNDVGPLAAGDLGEGLSFDGQLFAAGWGDTFKGEISATTIANISLTEDATGTWELLIGYGDAPTERLAGTVEGGAIVPEPASLALLGLGGLAVLRRR